MLNAQQASFKVQIIYAKPAKFTGTQSRFSGEPVENAVRILSGSENLLNLLEREGKPLHTPWLWKHDVRYRVVSDVLPGPR